ncbi:MAG: hypothetical protein PHS86_00890 [Syntrophaceae bacterium]|nr:hypothetical protein [Syntrophaceae bacterium]
MKRSSLYSIGSFLFVCLLFGCATTSDPSKGGFFDGVQGLSSGQYQRRVNQKEDNLASLKDTGAQLRGEQRALNRQADSLERQEQAYRQQLSQLNHDVTNLEVKLRKAKLQNQAKLAQRKNLQNRLANLKGQLQNKEQQPGSGDAQNQEDLLKMKAEKEKLQDDILKLTSQ